MADATPALTVRLRWEQSECLGALGEATGRSADELVAEAVGAYLEADAWITGEIEQAFGEADTSGSVVDVEDVARWLRSWGEGNEPEPPTPKR